MKEETGSPTNRRDHTNTSILVGGNSLSYLGDLTYLIAINAWVARVTSSPDLLGILTAVSSFALFVGNPIGGSLADRLPKRWLLFFSDVISAAAVALVYVNYESNHIPTDVLLIANALLSLAFGIYSPTSRSIAPLLVNEGGLRRLNALLSLGNETVRVGAPLLAGLLLLQSTGAEKQLILLNLVSFLISAASCLVLQPTAQSFSNESSQGLWTGYRKAWAELGRARILIASVLILNFFIGGMTVLLPFVSRSSTGYSALLLAQAIGAILGSVFISISKITLRTSTALSLLVLTGFFLLLLGASKIEAIQWTSIGGSGFLIAVFNINIFTLLQRSTKPELLGRTFGILFTAASALVPLGNLVFGKFEAAFPTFGVLMVGVGLTATMAAITLYERRKQR